MLINNILIFLFSFFLSTQLGKHFFFSFSYFNAVKIDYLSIAVYFTDIIAVLIILYNFKIIYLYARRLLKRIKKKRNSFILLLLIVVFITFNVSFAVEPWIALYNYVKLLEVLLLYLIFIDKRFRLNRALIFWGLGASALIEVYLGFSQVLNGSSMQGLFYFLGERLFSLSTPGVAKVSLSGRESLRVYGTFSHPNSLGGFYLMLFGVVYTSKSFSNLAKLMLGFLFGVLVILSFSKLAILGLGFVIVFYHLKTKSCVVCKLSKLGLLLFFIILILSYHTDTLTVYKRVVLLKESVFIFVKRPLIGVGLGNYIPAKSLIKNHPEKFFTQYREPVHNIFVLIFTEIGLIGSVLLGFLLKKTISYRWVKKHAVVLLLILYLGLFDHYLITLQQNLFLLPLILCM